jgi:choline-sulfatase
VPHHMRGHAFPRQPVRADSMAAVKAMFDGYDTGVRYADEHLGRVFNQLADLGILDETAIIISADHGENLGELNIYGDHQTADYVTTRVPLIIKWPGVTDAQAGHLDHGLHYHFDMAATVAELAGASIPEDWDGRSFAADLRAGREGGRDHLVLSQAAWCCQRAVRTREHIYIRTYDDAWRDYPDEMLFNITADPHEQQDLAEREPALVAEGRVKLSAWRDAALARSDTGIDPMDTVLAEGGSLHAREGVGYLDRLRATGRSAIADRALRKRSRAVGAE